VLFCLREENTRGFRLKKSQNLGGRARRVRSRVVVSFRYIGRVRRPIYKNAVNEVNEIRACVARGA